MDNSPIFSNPQKRIKMSWGNAGLIAGFIAAASIILFILIITYSASSNIENISFSIIALRVLGGIAMFSSLTGIVLGIIGIGQNKAKAIGGIALNIFLLILVSLVRSAYVPILPDERGIVISAFEPKGYRSAPLEPGLHWILPFVEFPQVYSVAPQTYIMASSSNQGDDSIRVQTRDGQNFAISVAVTYSIDLAKVVKLHVTWQNRYEENVVRPVVRGLVREIASEYKSLEIMRPARKDLEQTITEQLDPKFSENDLILIHFEITDVLQVK
jgi:regulator of protease activity HflC (stomatin/prohibitin superfamily)